MFYAVFFVSRLLQKAHKLKDSYEINGSFSTAVTWNSALNDKFEGDAKSVHQMTVKAGHAGTLYSPDTHSRICAILNS